jgi:hypothetical protein
LLGIFEKRPPARDGAEKPPRTTTCGIISTFRTDALALSAENDIAIFFGECVSVCVCVCARACVYVTHKHKHTHTHPHPHPHPQTHAFHQVHCPQPIGHRFPWCRYKPGVPYEPGKHDKNNFVHNHRAQKGLSATRHSPQRRLLSRSCEHCVEHWGRGVRVLFLFSPPTVGSS